MPAEPKSRRLHRSNHPKPLVATLLDERRRFMGSLASNEVPRLDGNLEHIFGGLIDGTAVACLPLSATPQRHEHGRRGPLPRVVR